jgi:hypothetical protein
MPPKVSEILSRRGLSQPHDRSTQARNRAASNSGPGPNDAASSLSNSSAAARIDSSDWLDWIRIGLPPELAPHVVQVLLKGGQVGEAGWQLIVFADSPAWCARLRYALLALEERIRARDPAIGRMSARVMRLA